MAISAELINDNEIQLTLTLEMASWLCSVISGTTIPYGFVKQEEEWYTIHNALNRAVPNGLPVVVIYSNGEYPRFSADSLRIISDAISQKVL